MYLPLRLPWIIHCQRSMSHGATELEGRDSAPGVGPSTSSRKWRRRQRIEDLLASCSTEVLKFERGAAREVAAAEHATRLIAARSSLHIAPALPPVVPSSSSCLSAPSALLEQPQLSTDMDDNTRSRSATVLQGPTSLQDGTPEPQPDGTPEQRGSCRRGSAASIATELLRLLARDNTVLECNVRDYDIALSSTIEEAVRLKVEVRQLEGACGQMDQLRNLLQREMRVRSQLRHQNAHLLDRHHNLLAAIRQAAEADDGESASLIHGLIAENTALRRLLSKVGSSQEASAGGARQRSLPEGVRAHGLQSSQNIGFSGDNASAVTLADRNADLFAEEIHAAEL